MSLTKRHERIYKGIARNSGRPAACCSSHGQAARAGGGLFAFHAGRLGPTRTTKGEIVKDQVERFIGVADDYCNELAADANRNMARAKAELLEVGQGLSESWSSRNGDTLMPDCYDEILQCYPVCPADHDSCMLAKTKAELQRQVRLHQGEVRTIGDLFDVVASGQLEIGKRRAIRVLAKDRPALTRVVVYCRAEDGTGLTRESLNRVIGSVTLFCRDGIAPRQPIAVDGLRPTYGQNESWQGNSDNKNIPHVNKEALALATLAEHPEWPDTKIAETVGCSRTSLYRWHKYIKCREILEQNKGCLPSGSKGEDGTIEAWNT